MAPWWLLSCVTWDLSWAWCGRGSLKDVVGEHEWELSCSSPSVATQGDRGVQEDIITQGLGWKSPPIFKMGKGVEGHTGWEMLNLTCACDSSENPTLHIPWGMLPGAQWD